VKNSDLRNIAMLHGLRIT